MDERAQETEFRFMPPELPARRERNWLIPDAAKSRSARSSRAPAKLQTDRRKNGCSRPLSDPRRDRTAAACSSDVACPPRGRNHVDTVDENVPESGGTTAGQHATSPWSCRCRQARPDRIFRRGPPRSSSHRQRQRYRSVWSGAALTIGRPFIACSLAQTVVQSVAQSVAHSMIYPAAVPAGWRRPA